MTTSTFTGSQRNSFDAIVVGGGHNGLVTAAYLGRAGLRVAILEQREILGGPCGTYEFLPGYRTAFTNSPGSLEPRIVQELELESFGLTFVRPDPTLVHYFPNRCFIGWRDRARVDAQLDAFCRGEAERYHRLLRTIEHLAASLGISLYEPSPNLAEAVTRLPSELAEIFQKIFYGSLRDLLDEALVSEQAKAILGMVALNVTLSPPSAPGTAVGLLLRPLSIASTPPVDANDPRRTALRGSTGLPIGGMGAIIDALEARCRSYGAYIRTATSVAKILHRNGRAIGAATTTGDEYTAPVIISSINPQLLFGDLLDDEAVPGSMRNEIAALPMRGSAFKIVLALDGVPTYANLPADIPNHLAVAAQFRIGSSLDYLENAVVDALQGRPSERPLIWGLTPSITSPGMAPEGKHLLSANIWHAPYELASGTWRTEAERFGNRCIDALSELMPDLRDKIIDMRVMSPTEIESELGLVQSHITHGDMLPAQLFGPRPHALANDYRTPLSGLYLTGSGTWPGGYVTGVPGFNTSRAVLADLRANFCSETRKVRWNS